MRGVWSAWRFHNSEIDYWERLPIAMDDSRDASMPILLFDGVCNLCNGAVQFIIDRDPAAVFRFASLQSPMGQKLMSEHGLDPTQLSTVILLENGQIYTKSNAALRVASRLRFPWWLAAAGWIIPRFIRDALYNTIARNRYRWFGQSEVCRIPTPELRARFLES